MTAATALRDCPAPTTTQIYGIEEIVGTIIGTAAVLLGDTFTEKFGEGQNFTAEFFCAKFATDQFTETIAGWYLGARRRDLNERGAIRQARTKLINATLDALKDAAPEMHRADGTAQTTA